MQGPGSRAIALALAAFAGACTSSGLPKLPPAEPAPESTGRPALQGPVESALMVSGTPTGVYAQVARGILNCWFGAEGPLKAGHVFQAQAEPPATGGAAEIVVHERDVTLRDQRGTRAYRISFAAEATGVRVGVMALKFELPVAQAMARDVEVWAKGGAGCELRKVMPPPPPAAPKGGASAKKKR